MHFTLLSITPVAPLAILADPASAFSTTKDLIERLTALVKPPLCVCNDSTTLRQTKGRSKAFAHALNHTQNIADAFTYIVSDYFMRLSDLSYGERQG